MITSTSNQKEEFFPIIEAFGHPPNLRSDISKNISGKEVSEEKKILFGSEKKRKEPIFKEESKSRRPPIQASNSDPQMLTTLHYQVTSDQREGVAGIYKSNLEEKTSNKLSNMRAIAGSKGSNVVLGSTTGVMTGHDFHLASLSPIMCSDAHIKSLRHHKLERARSLEKTGKEDCFGTKFNEIYTTKNRQLNASNSKKQVAKGFWDKEFQPTIRTRVISRGSKQVQMRETRPQRESGLMAKQPKIIPRNLTELLQEMNNSADSMSMNLEDEEEFDFDKESKKCEDQISQIKDAYVVDLPDLNADKEIGSPTGNQEAAFEAKADDEPDKKGSSSVFKKIAYFTSVAATTGFYFLMRRHQIL
jgi:hypothetical protein